MNLLKTLLIFASLLFHLLAAAQKKRPVTVSRISMEKIFNEIKTPFKYGVVFKHADSTKLMDSPTIFNENGLWYMTYIIFDGKGYETWIAQSADLLNWKSLGRILSFSPNTWDANQKAGYMSLVDINWGGTYAVEKFNNKYWMSYLGGKTTGYEAGVLAVGMATNATLDKAVEWEKISSPILKPTDTGASWFDNQIIYKSSVIRDKHLLTHHPFVMYYNAKGDTAKYESIGMAVSDDMLSWKRLSKSPVVTRYKGICGDAQIAKINQLYVMFYFGAFWKPGAFERFACSYDLVNWTEWKGEDLIAPSNPYDEQYAHKPWVIKWKGIVYHFYTAVGKEGRVIALATSKDLKNNIYPNQR